MLLKVRVTPRASRNLVKEENGIFKVYLTKPATDGLANEQLIESLSRHLKVKKYQLQIVSGLRSRDKVVKING
jgi:uncharacterized protein